MTPWSSTDELQPYYAALRDRLIGFFESEGITHKPKLIALAGVGKHAGDAAVAMLIEPEAEAEAEAEAETEKSGVGDLLRCSAHQRPRSTRKCSDQVPDLTSAGSYT